MDRWYGSDDIRESWCLLILESANKQDQPYVRKWVIGDANAEQLLETNQQAISNSGAEPELLDSLGDELDDRRYQDITLITPTQETLKILRGRFLSVDAITQPTLRGFRHIALADIINRYFDSSVTDRLSVVGDDYSKQSGTGNSQQDDELDINWIWNLTVDLVPLVPPEALQGELI